jgi:uncharacterized DUF497 family protein
MAVEPKCLTLVRCATSGTRRRRAATSRSTGSLLRKQSRRSQIVHPERAILIAMSWKMRVLVTVFIEKSDDELRLISARPATRRERRRYEEGE